MSFINEINVCGDQYLVNEDIMTHFGQLQIIGCVDNVESEL